MSDLEPQMAGWRRAMLAARIKSSVLDELEGHLREDIERRIESGNEPQKAFDAAAARMGSPAQLRHEFQKVPFKPFINMTPIARQRLTNLLVVTALIAISVAFLLPPVAKLKAHETLAFWDIVICVVGVVTMIGGGFVAARMRLIK
jgi:hypothetical protein